MQKEEGDYMVVKKEKARECKYMNFSLGSVCSPCIQKELELLQDVPLVNPQNILDYFVVQRSCCQVCKCLKYHEKVKN